jgi:RNA polymerase sigma factor (sigma-70 family)
MAHSGEDPEPDSSLIRLSLNDSERFTTIVERHAEALHRYLSKRAPKSAVDDLLADTLLTAFRSRENYDLSYLDARPWLFGIATNIVRHHRRSEGRRIARMKQWRIEDTERDRTEEVESDVMAKAEMRTIQWALDQLDGRYRDVLMLVAGPGLTYEEVARALEIPTGTVRSRMSRGRIQLRELLDFEGQYRHRDERTNGSVSTVEGLSE